MHHASPTKRHTARPSTGVLLACRRVCHGLATGESVTPAHALSRWRRGGVADYSDRSASEPHAVGGNLFPGRLRSDRRAHPSPRWNGRRAPVTRRCSTSRDESAWSPGWVPHHGQERVGPLRVTEARLSPRAAPHFGRITPMGPVMHRASPDHPLATTTLARLRLRLLPAIMVSSPRPHLCPLRAFLWAGAELPTSIGFQQI